MGRKHFATSASLFYSVVLKIYYLLSNIYQLKNKNDRSYLLDVRLSRGFTLVELLVVSAILGALVVVAISVINPSLQLGKGKDARRQEDLGQIRSALDTYYNDKNAYPSSLTFGSSFSDGAVVYMKTVPQDPDGSSSYQYITDTLAVKPQWVVLFAKLSQSGQACSLTAFSTCTPRTGYSSNWMCLVVGNIDANACTKIHAKTLP